MNTYNWYENLIKPSWAPPYYLFGSVWSILYVIIFVSFGTVFYQVAIGKIPWMIALPFVLNLVFNAAFAPLQFALRNNVLASIDIILLLITLIWAMIAIWPYLRWVTYASIPYVLWVSFATVLQLKLSYLNR